jgi:hypothetical protein
MTRPRSPRPVLSPLLLLVALITVLTAETVSASAGHGPETRVRAIPTATAAAVGQPSSETAGHIGCLRPSQPSVVSGSCVATEAAPFGEIGPAGNPGLLPTQQHHVFPQKYRSTFENAGVAIDDFTVPLNRTQHLKGVHGSGLPGQGLPGRWNQRWGEWLDANPGAGAKEIFQQGGQMMDDFGLGGLPIGPYKGVR